MNNEYFLSINEVSKKLDLPAHTLRYWEKQFPTAIKPTTGAGGRRYYRPETVDALIKIKDHLYNRGMTIAGVKKIIKNGDLLVPTSVVGAGCVLSDKNLTNGNADDGELNKNNLINQSVVSQNGATTDVAMVDVDGAKLSHAIELLESAKKELKN